MSEKSGIGNNADCEALLSVSEAAAMLNVSKRTIWRMIASGELEAVHVRGCTRILRGSVEKYLGVRSQVECV
jgi:excisionase family DNA binding protein